MKNIPFPNPEILEVYREWRSPRLGKRNPDNLTNDAWIWAIRNRISAYKVDKLLGDFDPQQDGPAWSFSRYAQSETELANGSTLYIGGAHEDHYDANFYVYNDVVVENPNGHITIYGYPETTFPPTDYHSATEVNDSALIIGNVGWNRPNSDRKGTPVYVLDLLDFSIERVTTSGELPQGLNGHEATLSDDGLSIRCEGGSISHPKWATIDNIDAWQLSLSTFSWTRLTKVDWPRIVLFRKPWNPNRLNDVRYISRAEQTGRWGKLAVNAKARFEREGHVPDSDLFEDRYSPPLPHICLTAEDDDFRIHRISVDGVVVVYREESEGVYITIEGTLPADAKAVIFNDAQDKLQRLENVPYTFVSLDV